MLHRRHAGVKHVTVESTDGTATARGRGRRHAHPLRHHRRRRPLEAADTRGATCLAESLLEHLQVWNAVSLSGREVLEAGREGMQANGGGVLLRLVPNTGSVHISTFEIQGFQCLKFRPIKFKAFQDFQGPVRTLLIRQLLQRPLSRPL